MAAPNAAPTVSPQSEMQKDMQSWKDKISSAARDHQTVTNIPGDAAWTSSFFDCFSPGSLCCLTCCCPCVTFGRTHHRLTHGDLSTYSPLNFSCVGWYISAHFCLSWAFNMIQRGDIRKRANPHLRGDGVTDCLKACFCGCCDLIQQEKEAEALLAREKTVTAPPPLTEGMNYAPPTQ